nr:unnamed protein product [Spirometra erinaceieuropaei]
MNEEAVKSFDDVKTALVSATLFAYPRADAQLTPMTDASGTAVGASLQKTVNGFLQPLAFFSNNLSIAETHYSAIGHEFFAVYLSIRHFQHFLEGREFVVLTGRKPLVFALRVSPNRYLPREIHHLDFVSQFSCDIQNVHAIRLAPEKGTEHFLYVRELSPLKVKVVNVSPFYTKPTIFALFSKFGPINHFRYDKSSTTAIVGYKTPSSVTSLLNTPMNSAYVLPVRKASFSLPVRQL